MQSYSIDEFIYVYAISTIPPLKSRVWFLNVMMSFRYNCMLLRFVSYMRHSGFLHQ